MKLSELAKREETVTVKFGDHEVVVLLTSMTSTDIQERNEYYESALKKSIEHAHDRMPMIFKEVDEMTDEDMRANIYQNDAVILEENADLIEIENDKTLTPDQIKEEQLKEKGKILEKMKVDLKATPRDDLKIKTQIYYFRALLSKKFVELMDVPTLTLIVKDPETEKRMLSMDPAHEDYAGNVDGKVLQSLLDESYEFRKQIDAWGIRELVEDPSFLLSSRRAWKKE